MKRIGIQNIALSLSTAALMACGSSSLELEPEGVAIVVPEGQGLMELEYDLPGETSAVFEIIPESEDRAPTLGLADASGAQIFVTPPGTYRVRMTPLEGGDVLEHCEVVETWADVAEGFTTVVSLISNCEVEGPGAIVVTASLNYPPTVEQLTYAPVLISKTCEPTRLTAEATDPEGDAITYTWTLGEDGQQALAVGSSEGESITATFVEPGHYEVEIEVCDSNQACTAIETYFIVEAGESECSRGPYATQWRIRNASRPAANAWALRGLRFCTDARCEGSVTGNVIDDGRSPSWGSAASIFDDDGSNFWKSFAGPQIGAAFVGLELEEPTHIAAIALRPDNVVYGVDSIFVEYFDDEAGEWITHSLLTDLPKHYGELGAGPSYANTNVWHIEVVGL